MTKQDIKDRIDRVATLIYLEENLLGTLSDDRNSQRWKKHRANLRKYEAEMKKLKEEYYA